MKLSIYGNNVGKPGQVISWSGTTSGSVVVDAYGCVLAEDVLEVGGKYTFTVPDGGGQSSSNFMAALREASKLKGSPLTTSELHELQSRCKP